MASSERLVAMSWKVQTWSPSELGRRPRDRWGGTYWSYVPFALASPEWRIDPHVSQEAARVERRIRHLNLRESAGRMEALSRYLLRSEAVSSSFIEGVQSSARKIALEELKREEYGSGTGARSVSITAEAEIVGNIDALTRAVGELGNAERIEWSDIEKLQRELLPGRSNLGTRDRQNWVGGNSFHPGEAEFIPPSPDDLEPALEDLSAFLNGSSSGPLIQAGIAHAQFETLHPFADGNGRIGRALIHTVLARTGLTQGAVLPLSQVLLTRSDEYVTALMAYRGIPAGALLTSEVEPKRSLSLNEGINAWLGHFIGAADSAVDLALDLKHELDRFDVHSRQLVVEYAKSVGAAPPRSDSTVWKIVEVLPKLPALSINASAHLTGSSRTAAHKALEYLEAAGVLDERNIGKGTRGFVCSELFDLLNSTQRKWASTQFDTRMSPPRRPVPLAVARGTSSADEV